MHSDASAGLGPMGTAALAYALDEGFAVLRGQVNDKPPAEAHGHLDATTDPVEITRRWTETPNANVCIALAPSRLVVIDLDGDPQILYPAVAERLGFLPPTRIHMTAGGGAHLLYRVAEGTIGLGRKIRPFGPDLPVDILADGFIGAPPSIVNGKSYAVRS